MIQNHVKRRVRLLISYLCYISQGAFTYTVFNASEQNPGAFSTSVWFFRQVRTQQSLSGTDQNNRLSEVLLARFQVNSESDSTLNQLQKVNQKWYDFYSMNKQILQA